MSATKKCLTQKDARAPFTLLDLLLVVIACGFSAGMAVRSLAGQRNILPPLHWISTSPAGWDQEHILYGFAGVVGLGPIVQGIQFLRFGRRHWTSLEWSWSALGIGYALFPLIELACYGFSYIIPEAVLFWTGFALYVGFYIGPGIFSSVAAISCLRRLRTFPWSAWFALGVTTTWSGIWAWFVVHELLWWFF